MSSTFQTRQVSFTLQCLLLSVVTFAIHMYLTSYFFVKVVFFFPIWQVYAFNLLTTYLLYSIINYRYSKDKNSVFTTFMFSTLLKMGLVIVFLLPLLIGNSKDKKPDVFNFFIVYFLFLIFEVFSTTKFLKNDD